MAQWDHEDLKDPRYKKDYNMSDDFGFTAVDDTQLKSVSVVSNQILAIQQMINPFLTKLQQNPDKAMLKWPNRAQEVKAFQEKFNALCEDLKV